MLICLLCAGRLELWGMDKTRGGCEFCEGGGTCYEIPTNLMPVWLIMAVNVHRLAEPGGNGGNPQ